MNQNRLRHAWDSVVVIDHQDPQRATENTRIVSEAVRSMLSVEGFVEVAKSLGGVEVETKAGRYLLMPINKGE